MRFVRLFWFLFSIVIGAAVGLAYGWLVKPASFSGSLPATLRADFKTDYVLMVAEVYQKDGSVALAANRLSSLSSESPVRVAQQAVLYARELEYNPDDMDRLGHLVEGLQTWAPAVPAAPTATGALP
jgi:hypothetical protein